MGTREELLARLRKQTANPATQVNTERVSEPKVVEDKPPALEAVPTVSKLQSPSKLGEQLRMSLLDLEQSLLEKHPRMPTLLREVHKALQEQPENVILLNDEEAMIIFQGLEKQTGVELNIQAGKKASTAKKVKVSADSLGL
jgi:hypothetical protein